MTGQRSTGEAIIADIENRGDEAARQYLLKFHDWQSESLRLTRNQIDACIAALTPQVLAEIKFAQPQICRFAQVQEESLHDVEVETLPGVVLGHKNIPGGKYPLIASAHMGGKLTCG